MSEHLFCPGQAVRFSAERRRSWMNDADATAVVSSVEHVPERSLWATRHAQIVILADAKPGRVSGWFLVPA